MKIPKKQITDTDNDIPKIIERTKNILNIRAITEKRNRLIVSNISNMMVINLNGLPLINWDRLLIVKQWLSNNHSSYNPCVKKK